MAERTDAARFEAIQRASYARASKSVHASWPPESAMDADQIEQFLDQHRYAVVATTRLDGRPQAAPLAYFVRKGSFWFASAAGQRLRNLRHVPYLAVVISEGDGGDHRLLTPEGTAILHPVTAELAACWANRHDEEPAWATSMIQVTPERLFSYQARTTPPADG
jgi:general stress protein 26